MRSYQARGPGRRLLRMSQHKCVFNKLFNTTEAADSAVVAGALAHEILVACNYRAHVLLWSVQGDPHLAVDCCTVQSAPKILAAGRGQAGAERLHQWLAAEMECFSGRTSSIRLFEDKPTDP